MSKSESNLSNTRYRNFATVVYPESAPENWLDIVAEAKIPVLVSPLHDKDINPTGEAKKPHYHVISMYDGKKSHEQATEFFKSFGGVGCEVVKSIRGYARYLCHMDNPEKAQYSQDEVKAFGGADFAKIVDLPTDKYKCIKEMMQFADTNGNYSYSDLLEYASEYRFDWFRVLCDSGTVVVKEYLKSKQWKEDKDK